MAAAQAKVTDLERLHREKREAFDAEESRIQDGLSQVEAAEADSEATDQQGR